MVTQDLKWLQLNSFKFEGIPTNCGNLHDSIRYEMNILKCF